MAWKDDFKRYDTSKGFGSPKKWRKAFNERMSSEDAHIILDAQDDTPWGILGLPEGSTQAQIRTAFRKLIQEWHPDRNKASNATEMSQRIIAAYTILKT